MEKEPETRKNFHPESQRENPFPVQVLFLHFSYFTGFYADI